MADLMRIRVTLRLTPPAPVDPEALHHESHRLMVELLKVRKATQIENLAASSDALEGFIEAEGIVSAESLAAAVDRVSSVVDLLTTYRTRGARAECLRTR